MYVISCGSSYADPARFACILFIFSDFQIFTTIFRNETEKFVVRCVLKMTDFSTLPISSEAIDIEPNSPPLSAVRVNYEPNPLPWDLWLPLDEMDRLPTVGSLPLFAFTH